MHHPTIGLFLMYLECVVWAWFPSNTHPHVLSISPFLQHIIYFFYLKLINFLYITELRSWNIEFDSSSSPFLKLLYSNNTIVDLRFNISYLFRMLIIKPNPLRCSNYLNIMDVVEPYKSFIWYFGSVDIFMHLIWGTETLFIIKSSTNIHKSTNLITSILTYIEWSMTSCMASIALKEQGPP